MKNLFIVVKPKPRDVANLKLICKPSTQLISRINSSNYNLVWSVKKCVSQFTRKNFTFSILSFVKKKTVALSKPKK